MMKFVQSLYMLATSRKVIVAFLTGGVTASFPHFGLDPGYTELGMQLTSLVGSVLIGSIAYEDGKRRAIDAAVAAALAAIKAPVVINNNTTTEPQ